MKTQNEEILEHLKNHEGITSMQAINEYGITRLSGRIYDLRQQGHNIASRDKIVKNRHGVDVHVTEYVLMDKQEVRNEKVV